MNYAIVSNVAQGMTYVNLADAGITEEQFVSGCW